MATQHPTGRAIFVTATDTGVGKTYVACGLARALKRAGYRVAVCKPIASGVEQHIGGTFNSDTLALRQAVAPTALSLTDVTPVCFQTPVAPLVAAQLENQTIEIPSLLAHCQRLRQSHDYLIVEGVGGVRVPLVDQYCVIDLIKALEMPALVVAANRLGTINHTLLTVEALLARQIPIAGIVLNMCGQSTPDVSTASNAECLKSLLPDFPFFETQWNAAGSQSQQFEAILATFRV